MYPLSPRSCFVTNQNSRVASSEIIPSSLCAYPNSSNESIINTKDEINLNLSELDSIKVSNSNHDEKADDNRTVLKRISSNCSHNLDFNIKGEGSIIKPTKSNVYSNSFNEKNYANCDFKTENYANLSREHLYKIIYQKHDELQQIKLQLNEAKIKELNLGKNYELSIAKQNELKTINTSLENLVNQLRIKKNYQINSIASQLKIGNYNNLLFEKLDSLSTSIAELKEFASLLTTEGPLDSSELKKLKSTIDNLISHKEINSEIEYIKGERQQLIHLITALLSNTNFYIDNNCCDNELRNENVKQVNISLCDQIQILKFKLKRSSEIHKKKLSKIRDMLEILEQTENISSPSLIQEIKNEVNIIT